MGNQKKTLNSELNEVIRHEKRNDAKIKFLHKIL